MRQTGRNRITEKEKMRDGESENSYLWHPSHFNFLGVQEKALVLFETNRPSK